jgi:hypothetical protein
VFVAGNLCLVSRSLAKVGHSNELWRRRVEAEFPGMYSSRVDQQNLLNRAIDDALIPAHLESASGFGFELGIGDPGTIVSPSDLRLTWREILFLTRRIVPFTNAYNDAVNSMNKFAESSAKKKSAIKKKKKTPLEPLRPLQPDLGTSFVTSLLNDFFPVLADLTELELSAEQEEEAEPELQRPEVAGISNTQRNKLRTSFVLAALEILLQSMKRHRSRAARGKFTGFATTMGDIMKRVGSALERSRSREFAKSVSLVLTQVSRIVNVLYEPSLVRLLEIPFLFQY